MVKSEPSAAPQITSLLNDNSNKSLTTTNTSSVSPSLNPNSSKPNSNQNNSGFIQIYVPKIVSTSSNPNSTQATDNKLPAELKTTNSLPLTSPDKATNKKTAKKRTNSQSSATSTVQLSNLAPKIAPSKAPTPDATNSDDKQTRAKTPSLIAQLNNGPTAATSQNTKIINASNINLLRKIAIDSRSMPVIVTLNSNNDAESTNNNHNNNDVKVNGNASGGSGGTPQKQIKLVNSKIKLKPALANLSTNETSPIKAGPTLTGAILSPVKTTTLQLQSQKSSPLLIQLNNNSSQVSSSSLTTTQNINPANNGKYVHFNFFYWKSLEKVNCTEKFDF